MTVTIRNMTEREFECFRRWSVEQQTRELMEESQLSHDAAAQKAAEEVAEMLPDGFHTQNHTFLSVMAEGENVGFLWAIDEEFEGEKQRFLCDFAIWEPYRRRGYGEAALCLAQSQAHAAGREKIVLFVRDDNHSARRLYEKCGYGFLRREGCGRYMAKKLGV